MITFPVESITGHLPFEGRREWCKTFTFCYMREDILEKDTVVPFLCVGPRSAIGRAPDS